ncbi:MAG: hypothetical protein ACRBEE_14225 [Arenicella sp.]
MIEDKQKFNKALSIVLQAEGVSLEAGGELYIRSLEGESWCVGTLDRYGDINEETEYKNDLNGALDHFHKLNDKNSFCFG